MRDDEENVDFQLADNPAMSRDRREQDGAAGVGDMLGGLSTGAGGRLGPDAAGDDQATPASHQSIAGTEIPMDGNRVDIDRPGTA